ncbi:sugar kinase [Oceanobacillus kimchii]|uniref:sugar kinase n=1 Tax=Oceanobacillus kimchii TaxID=746691 RepID=UPI0003495F23|nr:sugar kinase [Oceanobacillus kimchii]MCT1576862.1 sugar kinase [Oceanobacillus kimchii]MCT2134932.1 sugar kinase [Oceanobacillus kimchii]
MANKVKAFGEVMMRLHVPGNKKLEQTRALDMSFSGTGVNVLTALGKFGNQTSLITTLPDNNIGEAALSYLQSLRVGVQDIRRDGDHIGMFFLEDGFDLRPSVVTYTNREISAFHQAVASDYQMERILLDTDMVHFCGIGLAVSENARNTMFSIAEKAKERGILVVFDCNFRPKLWKNNIQRARNDYQQMLQLSDVCFMTEKDAIHVLGYATDEVERKSQIQNLIPKVAEKYGIQTIAGTIREQLQDNKHEIEGFLYTNANFYFSKRYVFRIFDRIGGGDGFASGIMHGLRQQFSKEDTIQFAMAAGILAHTTYGDSPISSDKEVWALVSNHDPDIER